MDEPDALLRNSEPGPAAAPAVYAGVVRKVEYGATSWWVQLYRGGGSFNVRLYAGDARHQAEYEAAEINAFLGHRQTPRLLDYNEGSIFREVVEYGQIPRFVSEKVVPKPQLMTFDQLVDHPRRRRMKDPRSGMPVVRYGFSHLDHRTVGFGTCVYGGILIGPNDPHSQRTLLRVSANEVYCVHCKEFVSLRDITKLDLDYMLETGETGPKFDVTALTLFTQNGEPL